jgi:hypothetical protein
VNTRLDVAEAVTHLFDDREWMLKALVGGLLAGIPIVSFVVSGYEVRVIRNVSQGESRPMPAWEDFGGLFTDGLGLGMANFLLGLPLLVLFTVPAVALFGAVALAEPGAGEIDEIASALAGLGVLGLGGLCALGLVYALALGFVNPAIVANYARRGTLAACFSAAEIGGFIRRSGRDYLIAWASMLVAGLAISLAASVIGVVPCLGTLVVLIVSAPAGFWALMVRGHLVGQLLALDKGRRAGATAALAPA